MSRRGALAGVMIVGGLVLMVLAYFFWAAPWGNPPSSEAYSNPRVPLAPLVFIIGVMIAFLAAVVYELMPDKATPRT